MEWKAALQFYGYLPILLSRQHQNGELIYRFGSQHPSVKDCIEACGIPHTEVDLILAGNCCVGFAYQLQNDDRIRIYPPGFPIKVCSAHRLSPATPDPACFILDVHLGKLARRLRLLGFDCLYRNDYDDQDILSYALKQRRIILTRDRGILKRSCIEHGMLIRSDHVEEQVIEVLSRYRLYEQIRPLQRCPLCNGLLSPVEKQKIEHLLLPQTAQCCTHFNLCQSCGKLYWQGAHHKNISGWLAQVNPPVTVKGPP